MGSSRSSPPDRLGQWMGRHPRAVWSIGVLVALLIREAFLWAIPATWAFLDSEPATLTSETAVPLGIATLGLGVAMFLLKLRAQVAYGAIELGLGMALIQVAINQWSSMALVNLAAVLSCVYLVADALSNMTDGLK